MKIHLPKILVLVALFAVLSLFIILTFASQTIDRKLNAVSPGTILITDRARKLHASLVIVDLHADSLLWDRNLLERNRRGHLDIPRLKDGNVALQAFTIVTSVPKRSGSFKGIDQITLLSLVERWSPDAWFSLKERVLHQTEKLKQFADSSKGKFTLIKNAEDLNNYLLRRNNDHTLTAGILGIEGAHALEGDIKNIDLFYDHGIRMMSPSHFFDNNIGGSSHGDARGGLSELGKEMVRRMQERSMIVDLAHASSATIRDTLKISTKPVLVSHTGVKGIHNSDRNLSDDEIVAIARTGGVIGIGYWKEAIGSNNPADIARAIKYAANLAGVEHIALGSDFDGACAAPFDVANLVCVTQALINEGFSDFEIRLIMGENTLRVLKSGLPNGPNIFNNSKSVDLAN